MASNLFLVDIESFELGLPIALQHVNVNTELKDLATHLYLFGNFHISELSLVKFVVTSRNVQL